MTVNNKIHVVMGISSAGKSTYVKSNLSATRNSRVVMASSLFREDMDNPDTVVHYNLFRPYRNNERFIENDFLVDDSLNLILEAKDKTEITFVLTERSTLIKRIALRQEIEPLFKRSFRKSYPSEKILKLLIRINYENFHRKWFDLFEQHGVTVRYVHSTNGGFTVLKNTEEAMAVVRSDKKEDYSRNDVKRLRSRYGFGNRSVDLPHGSSMKGQAGNAALSVFLNEEIER